MFDFDHRVRETSSFHFGSYVIVDKPSSAKVLGATTETLANNAYSKRQHRISGLYRILKAQSSTVTMDEYGVPDTVSIH